MTGSHATRIRTRPSESWGGTFVVLKYSIHRELLNCAAYSLTKFLVLTWTSELHLSNERFHGVFQNIFRTASSKMLWIKESIELNQVSLIQKSFVLTICFLLQSALQFSPVGEPQAAGVPCPASCQLSTTLGKLLNLS